MKTRTDSKDTLGTPSLGEVNFNFVQSTLQKNDENQHSGITRKVVFASEIDDGDSMVQIDTTFDIQNYTKVPWPVRGNRTTWTEKMRNDPKVVKATAPRTHANLAEEVSTLLKSQKR
jgi:hypothetical protein